MNLDLSNLSNILNQSNPYGQHNQQATTQLYGQQQLNPYGQQPSNQQPSQNNLQYQMTNDLSQYLNTAESYQQVEHKEHVLMRPGTYIGSVYSYPRAERILDMTDQDQMKFDYANVSIPSGLERLFLEILSNASDNGVESRMQGFDIGKIDIKMNTKTISVRNGGKPIPIQRHKTGLWVPEVIFGVLLTSGNYDTNKIRTGAGLNGLGAKLTNIYSKRFFVDIGDPYNNAKYTQLWENNMSIKHEPTIVSYNGEAYVYIEYEVDFPRFFYTIVDNTDEKNPIIQYSPFTDYPAEAFAFFARHAADIAYCCKIPIVFNDIKLPVDDVYTYAMWMGNYNENCIIHYEWPPGTPLKTKKIGKRMIEYTSDDKILPIVELCILDTPYAGSVTSYVNCMMTPGGGVHVDAAQKGVIDKILGIVNNTDTKKKKEKAKDTSRKLKLNAGDVKRHLTIILSCHLENPEYVGGNTKDKLGGPKPRINIPDKILKQINEWNIVARLAEELELKQIKNLGGKKKRNLDAYKGSDANFAGSAKSNECSLFLVEGDSAKKFAISLISNIPNGTDYYGVFPLRGKMLNVQRANIQQYYLNKEIESVKEYLNAREGIDYRNPAEQQSLRYGRIISLTDADEDGEHIKGLIYNFVFHKLNTLLYIPGFLTHFRTPIIKATKGNEYFKFYTLLDYKNWITSRNNEVTGWTFGYYKGLGTFEKEEAIEEIQAPLTTTYLYDEQSPSWFFLAFAKKFEDERKKWIIDYKPFEGIEKYPQLPLSSFIQYELVRYSISNIERSIPSMRDGFKPSQRKIIHVCFTRWGAKVGSAKAERHKVSGFAGKVSDETNYTHGQVSLEGAIVTLACDYVGTNNLNLLYPNGQFGNRLDPTPAASRYIFTRPTYIWPYLFSSEDKDLLTYIYDEGRYIEPEFFLPIIPPSATNGARGIGSGFSTFIPNYNPIDIANWLICRVQGTPLPSLKPWYRGFNGTIEIVDRTKKVTSFDIGTPIFSNQQVTDMNNGTNAQNMNVQSVTNAHNMDVQGATGAQNLNGQSVTNAHNMDVQGATGAQEINTMAKMFRDSVIDNMEDVEEAKEEDEEEDDDPLGLDEIGFSGKSKSHLAMVTSGCFHIEGNKVIVTELPIGPSFEAYEEWLKKLRSNKHKKSTKKDGEPEKRPLLKIKDFKKDGDLDTHPRFIIEGFTNPTLKSLRLIKSYSLGNMVLLDGNNKPTRYPTVEAMIESWLQWRFPFYEKRKQLMLKKITDKIMKLNCELRFIIAVIEGTQKGYIQGQTIILMRKRKDEILPQMYAIGIPADISAQLFKNTKLSQCTYEKVEKLMKMIQKQELDKHALEQTPSTTLMINDLTEFIRACEKHDHYSDAFKTKGKNKKGE